ncbi:MULTISPECIES: DUF192 domain-containing protein [Methylomonas]|uniref:ACR family protein n=2 Tax=Methylomonas TaxID=416 RepID=A0A126T7D4_9GAMM|nr:MULTISPECIES: DUF192 domain-containing protein [Methylomonas]AMK77999.1 hypothetical protein JT25_016180 [Methylomonas denitrificans]OAI07700.1 hypothetical protein A1342_10460 [Methylomonas methanica]TCV85535.1 hypothetical protein EDE11_10594 [Methylomonas methanica]
MHSYLSRSIFGIVFLVALNSAGASANALTEFNHQITFVDQQRIVYVAIAANESEREHGLMFRQALAEDQGMLFVYPDQSQRAVWMKNTLLALDVVFLSGDGRIAALLKDLQPCSKDPCRIYNSKVPARYILELPAGFIDKHAIKIGQTVTLP